MSEASLNQIAAADPRRSTWLTANAGSGKTRVLTDRVARLLLAELGEPLLSSTLLLPGEPEPLTDGWEIKERLEHQVDAVIDSGESGLEPTTVIDFSSGTPEVVRVGAGDPTPFE